MTKSNIGKSIRSSAARVSAKSRPAFHNSIPSNNETTAPATILVTPPPQAFAGKAGIIVDMLKRTEGATVEALSEATGWQNHSIRGFISGTLKKKLGLDVASETSEAGRIYRLAESTATRSA